MASWCDKCKLPRFETNNDLGKRLGQLLVKMEMSLQQKDHDDLLRTCMADAHDISRRLLGKTKICQSGSGICVVGTAPTGAGEPPELPNADMPPQDGESEVEEIQEGVHQLRVVLPSRVLVPRLTYHAPDDYEELRGVGRGCDAYPDFSAAAVPVVGNTSWQGQGAHYPRELDEFSSSSSYSDDLPDD